MITSDVLTLLSGNLIHFRNWNYSINKLEFDQHPALRILDNSGDKSFGNLLKENKPIWAKKFTEVSVISYLKPYQPENPDDSMEKGRHSHVAQLYSRLFLEVKTDLALTFEEDIIPQPDAFKNLLAKFDCNTVGAIGGAYTSPQNREAVCAAFGNKRWARPVPWRLLNGQLVLLDYIGGGFTLWNLTGLKDVNIGIDWDRRLGWDAILCERLSEKGLKILLAGDVVCKHNNRYIDMD
jgi:cellulose synthase/poly-beta-1,6-N-acetylglucosamine synthase-like glycosyltransferase